MNMSDCPIYIWYVSLKKITVKEWSVQYVTFSMRYTLYSKTYPCCHLY